VPAELSTDIPREPPREALWSIPLSCTWILSLVDPTFVDVCGVSFFARRAQALPVRIGPANAGDRSNSPLLERPQ